ncbi:MaoC family dehydratase N-terminal domain-containing protein [Croceicoccus sp. F390]|uniref:MaoC family dehydratase N-terminal domain-containing protein n=1 Tax=Croceicoccus esteveae TaxID=3075597 RepID=A0ABU2ZFJ7_9SPHN|nr:MaoC family dehydratase N-terminal domain-containing protein [Croceicoccus sp. F390]MDT0575375.1 MaoC family dehydratase N-terminal domain-containing protein [Croceicoccus sp. F390]
MTESKDVLQEARIWVGKQSGKPARARDPVNVPMIRRWCEAMGLTDPVYVDRQAAQAAGYRDIIAPAAMMEVWTMSAYDPRGRQPEDSIPVIDLFDDHGYIGVVATDLQQEYMRPLVVGDVITCTIIVDDVSDEKRTALGIGHFVTLRHEFTDQDDQIVGQMMFRILKFKPNLKQDEAASITEAAGAKPDRTPAHPRPGITHDHAHYWKGIAERKLLIQQCSGCGRLRHPPGPACPVCHALEWEAKEASGRGKLHSFVVVHQPKVPGFSYPLPVLLVELEEGVRMVANAIDVDRDALTIGADLMLDFLEVEPGYLLPGFRLAKVD